MDSTEQNSQIIGDPRNSIPKFATNVNFGKLENGDIVITFLHRVNPESPAVLIETVVVDEEHAKKILEVLEKIIKS